MEKDVTFSPSTALRTDTQIVCYVLLDVILLDVSEVIHHCLIVDGGKKIGEIQILWENKRRDSFLLVLSHAQTYYVY